MQEPADSRPLIDTVVFDLGGVLIDWDPRHLYRSVFDDPARMEHFLGQICTPAWNAAQDAGRSWDAAVAELSAQHPGHAAHIALFRDRWADMLAGPIEGTVGIMQRLRGQGMRLYALTNWSRETFPVARARYAFLGDFIDILVSGEEGLIKPDPAIFALMQARFSLVPARTLFIDDAPRNVEAAHAAGLHAVRFEDPPTLEAALAGYRLVDAGTGR